MLSQIDYTVVPAFALVLVRLIAFFVTVPLFSYKNVPTTFKIGFSFFLAMIIFFTIDRPTIPVDSTYFLLLFKEALVGLSIGLLAFIVMQAINVAGGLIDFQMGFAIANVIDPVTRAQSPLTGQFLYTIATLFLLSINGHLLLIDGIFYSYQLIPLDEMVPFGSQDIVDLVLHTFGQMFLIAFQMSIPIVGSLFLVDVAIGIVARTVPQLNVFVVGPPIKILVAFVLLFISIGVYMTVVRQLFDYMLVTMRDLMVLFGGA
ncbi:flagellar biosynthetic protein FliR [Terribacillus halophilus]|jgi:flagellar biosynthesis protein FliR|uniref:flagellar biosynthetic protein FliR n=1 Tax=Terribacillus halophilus TaxID=361279 RepID=UPI000987236F|nr:flagellar biosynthetic protein FliR [Terribacillus halophilus]